MTPFSKAFQGIPSKKFTDKSSKKDIRPDKQASLLKGYFTSGKMNVYLKWVM